MRHAFVIGALLMGMFLAGCQTTGPTTAAYVPAVKEVLDTTKPTKETVEYVSGNLDFYRDVFAGKLYDPVILSGKLHLPAGDGPFPVVVWQHGSGGPATTGGRQWRKDLRDNLRSRGIGLFIADSYTARRQGSTSRNQGRLSGTARVMDAFGALEALSDHPRVDRNRIGLAGPSWGGIVTLNATNEAYAAAIMSDGARFAAHAAFFPSCGTKMEDYRPTPAPVLMLLGELDDMTDHEPCLEKADRFRAAGGKVETVVYPGAHHDFISSLAVKFKPRYWHFNDCGLRIQTASGEVLVPKINVTSEGLSFSELIDRYVSSGCGKRGVHIGRNAAAAKDAMLRVVQFFDSSLKS